MEKYDNMFEFIKANFDLKDYAGRRESLINDIKEELLHTEDYFALNYIEPALTQIEQKMGIDLNDELTFVKFLFEDIKISSRAEFIFEDRTECSIVGCYKINTPNIHQYAEMIIGDDCDYSSDTELTAYVSVYDNEDCSIDIQVKERLKDGKIITDYYSGQQSVMIPTEAENEMARLLIKEVGAVTRHDLISMTAAQKEIDYSNKMIIISSKPIYLGVECEILMPKTDMIYMIEKTGLQTDSTPAIDMLDNAKDIHLFASEAGTSTVTVTLCLDNEEINIPLSSEEKLSVKNTIQNEFESKDTRKIEKLIADLALKDSETSYENLTDKQKKQIILGKKTLSDFGGVKLSPLTLEVIELKKLYLQGNIDDKSFKQSIENYCKIYKDKSNKKEIEEKIKD